MTLEEFTAQLNGSTFWKEFTFSQNQFSPRPGQELELADSFIWLGDTAFIIQMKERAEPKEAPEAERRWFKDSVLKTAVRQIKDSIRFLEEHDSISIANERGQNYDVRGQDIQHIEKIILYAAGDSLPQDCRRIQYHISQTVGFIHIFERDSYRYLLETLAVPEEVRRYLEYRQKTLRTLSNAKMSVIEFDILAAYMSDELLPTSASHKALNRLFDDAEQTDLSPIMNRLADHIQNPDSSNDYVRILIEFAKLPRSGWRAAKERLDLVIKQAKIGQYERPYRFTFSPTDCSFMFSPFIPEMQSTSTEGEKARRTGLQNLTQIAKYLGQTTKGIGVLASKDGDYFHLDWCLIDQIWEWDPDLEAHIARSNLFGPVKEKKIDGYYFINE